MPAGLFIPLRIQDKTMAKIILGQRPKSFKRTVSFKQVDGSPGSIEVDYKYRTRSEFGEFADAVRAEIKAGDEALLEKLKKQASAGEAVKPLTQADILKQEDAINVRYVMGCIEGWNLDVPFDKAAVEQLADEVPAAITAIVAEYRDAITEGRSGN
jgi:hypothetical protein